MSKVEDQSPSLPPYQLFAYNPSFPLEIFFGVAFFISALLHSIQLCQRRSWFFLPFVIGGYFEGAGFMARIFLAKQSPNWELSLYIVQTLLLLLAPTLFAASIYMILSRIIRLTKGQQFSVMPVNWLTALFITGDVLSFMLQGAGGGSLASAKTVEDKQGGQNLIVAGLIVQLISFGLFILVSSIFFFRILRTPTRLSSSLTVPWKQLLILLITSSTLIFIRSTFRLIEYIAGSDSVLMKKEIYTILLDSTLMLLCMLLFNLFHPSQAIQDRTDNPTEIPVYNTPKHGQNSPIKEYGN